MRSKLSGAEGSDLLLLSWFFVLMPVNRSDARLRLRLLAGWGFRRGGGGADLGQDLLEGCGSGLWRLFLFFPFQVRVLSVACPADDLDDLIADKARNGMVHQPLAARTVIVNQIPKPWRIVLYPGISSIHRRCPL